MHQKAHQRRRLATGSTTLAALHTPPGVQELAAWVGQVHIELKQRLWANIRHAGAEEAPDSAAVPSGVVDQWDYQSTLTHQVRWPRFGTRCVC
jgi:hypothetical protein